MCSSDLLAGAEDPLALAERLQIPHRLHRLLAQGLRLRQRLREAGACSPQAGAWAPSRWCGLLEAPGVCPDAVALLLGLGFRPRRPLLRWLLRWRHIRSATTAAALLAAGVPAGPRLGERLRELRQQRLDDAEG
mgnify:FL=1